MRASAKAAQGPCRPAPPDHAREGPTREPSTVPKRTDIHKILIIGSGPIVIGQACEFDYSGTQACKALREEGYEVVLVNSNPATIMTDPEMADRTYIEPLTWEIVDQGHRDGAARRAAADARRADRPEHRRWTWHEHGVLEKYGVEMIGANAEVIDKAEDREQFKQAMEKIGLEVLPRRDGPHAGRGPRRARTRSACRASCGPASRWAAPAAASPTTATSSTSWSRRGLELSPGPRGADRRIDHRLERVRDGGDARQGRQRRHHLLDRELRPDGRPHRRLDHRRPGADADRQGIPADARRLAGRDPRDRRRDGRLEHPVRHRSRRRAG